MTANQILYLSQSDVVSVSLSMAEIIQLLETAFAEKGHGRVEMPPKPGIHPGEGDNFIHAMPAYIPALHRPVSNGSAAFRGMRKRGCPISPAC